MALEGRPALSLPGPGTPEGQVHLLLAFPAKFPGDEDQPADVCLPLFVTCPRSVGFFFVPFPRQEIDL